jgi:hypothetical protein
MTLTVGLHVSQKKTTSHGRPLHFQPNDVIKLELNIKTASHGGNDKCGNALLPN